MLYVCADTQNKGRNDDLEQLFFLPESLFVRKNKLDDDGGYLPGEDGRGGADAAADRDGGGDGGEDARSGGGGSDNEIFLAYKEEEE